MTVAATNAFSVGTGNGSATVFPFSFRCQDEAEVSVYLDNVQQFSGFSVVLSTATEGGSVTFTTPPALGISVVIASTPAFSMFTALGDSGPFLPAVIDAANDASAIRDIFSRARSTARSRLRSARPWPTSRARPTASASSPRSMPTATRSHRSAKAATPTCAPISRRPRAQRSAATSAPASARSRGPSRPSCATRSTSRTSARSATASPTTPPRSRLPSMRSRAAAKSSSPTAPTRSPTR
jgi:hypothetical protein